MNMLKSVAAAVALAGFGGGFAHAAVLNEIRIDQSGTDADEYFELAGAGGESLSGLTLVVIGDGTGASGVVERVYDLTGSSVPTDGYFLAAGVSDMPSFAGESVDLDLTPDTNVFENSDTLTFLLVTGNTAVAGDDLDTNDDGTFDVTWNTSVVDSVAVLDDASELPYSSTQIPPNGTLPYAAIYRAPNATGDWQFNADGFSSFANDTPGTANVPEPTSLAAIGLGAFGLLRRRRSR